MNFAIAHDPIDAGALRRAVVDQASGAYALFEGWVRDHHEGRAVLRLEYEVYEPLARKEGARIIAEAAERFGPLSAAAVHRTGLLELGEVAVAVVVSAAHRDEAFRACRYIIDEAKLRLPIWKKEYFADGHAEWVNCQRCAAHAHAHAGKGA
jgi:molybdopterin synthase catalytic subunit